MVDDRYKSSRLQGYTNKAADARCENDADRQTFRILMRVMNETTTAETTVRIVNVQGNLALFRHFL